MKGKKHSPEQIIKKLREADAIVLVHRKLESTPIGVSELKGCIHADESRLPAAKVLRFGANPDE